MGRVSLSSLAGVFQYISLDRNPLNALRNTPLTGENTTCKTELYTDCRLALCPTLTVPHLCLSIGAKNFKSLGSVQPLGLLSVGHLVLQCR